MPSIPFRYYRTVGLEKRPSPLTLDTTRIVVRDTSGTGSQETVLSPALRQFLATKGIAETEIKRCYRDYFWVTLPASMREASADTIEAFLATLSNEHPNCYVSPVFLNENGKAVVVTPKIDFTFSGGANRQTRRAILETLDAVVESPFDESDPSNWPTETQSEGVTTFYLRNPTDDPDRYLDYVTRLTHRAKNGLQILRIANELAASSSIASASVDCISQVDANSDPVVASALYPGDAWIWPLSWSSPFGIRVNAAWGLTTGASHIRVAVMDTGVIHQEIPLSLTPGAPYENIDTTASLPTTALTIESWHGTGVGGLIGERLNNEHSIGVAPTAPLLSFKTAAGEGYTHLTATGDAFTGGFFLPRCKERASSI